MLPALQKLRLVPCPTGMEAMDVDNDEPWERNVRRRVEALRVTTPDLDQDLVRVVCVHQRRAASHGGAYHEHPLVLPRVAPGYG